MAPSVTPSQPGGCPIAVPKNSSVSVCHWPGFSLASQSLCSSTLLAVDLQASSKDATFSIKAPGCGGEIRLDAQTCGTDSAEPETTVFRAMRPRSVRNSLLQVGCMRCLQRPFVGFTCCVLVNSADRVSRHFPSETAPEVAKTKTATKTATETATDRGRGRLAEPQRDKHAEAHARCLPAQQQGKRCNAHNPCKMTPVWHLFA